MNRRDFFKAVTAAVVAASAGIALTPEQTRYVAGYRRQLSLIHDGWIHRWDVTVGTTVYCVDVTYSGAAELPEAVVRDALRRLEAHIGENVSIAVAA